MKRIKKITFSDDFRNKWKLFLGTYEINKKDERKMFERYRRFLQTNKPIYLFFGRYSKFRIDLNEIKQKALKQQKNFDDALVVLNKLNSFQIKRIINLIS